MVVMRNESCAVKLLYINGNLSVFYGLTKLVTQMKNWTKVYIIKQLSELPYQTIFSLACSKYNCSIWRVDVGMSSGVLDSRPEVTSSFL